MRVPFTTTPTNLRIPIISIEFDNSMAGQGTPERKTLFFGQRLAAGTVAANTLTRVVSEARGEEYFGRASIMSAMFNAFKAANRFTDTWAIALDDAPAGVAAAGAVKFGGAVTEAGTAPFYAAGLSAKTALASGQSLTAIATAFAAAVNANGYLPVTAAVDGVDQTKVNLTCKWKGATGNDIDLRFCYYDGEVLPKGLTVTITAMTGGTTNPDIATAIAAMGNERFGTIIMPYTDAANLTLLETELQSRWTNIRVKAGVAWAAYRGSHAATGTFGNGRNGNLVTCMGTGIVPQPPYIWAAVNAAVGETALANDPARQLATLPLPGIMPPKVSDRWNDQERNLHLWDGISTYTVDAGGVVRIERQVTMYQKDAVGNDDEDFLDVTTPYTLIHLALDSAAYFSSKYPRHKLADDGTQFAAGQPIITPKIITAEWIVLARKWEHMGLIENVDDFIANLIVERDATNRNRVNALVPPDLVNNFIHQAVLLQFRL